MQDGFWRGETKLGWLGGSAAMATTASTTGVLDRFGRDGAKVDWFGGDGVRVDRFGGDGEK
ncbi:MAG: hypothetical protein ACRC0X_06155, partial [Brevinema sp.]